MKFMIERTRGISDTQPHEKAYKDYYMRVDTRNVDDPTKLNYRHDRENWYLEGKNHRVETGCIKRDFDDEDWFIDISTLEELILFKNEVKHELVIGNSLWNEDIPLIEIYDGYRE